MVSLKKKNSPKPSKPDQDSEDKKSFMRHYALVFELVILNLALIMGGYYLDEYLSTSPLIILIATFLAMAGTIWLLLKALK
mgnify:CR=1 FL=1